MNKIILTRKQIKELYTIIEKFSDIDTFTIESESTSGIGSEVKVRFAIFDSNDEKIDITDIESW